MITIRMRRADAALVSRKLLRRAARQTLAFAGAPAQAELTLVIGDDALLQQLNCQYRGIDAPTDVLSFPSGEIDPETQATYLGDVIISMPRAQAQSTDHALRDELQLLVVHGVLHLLGHDHGEAAEKACMQAAQDAILQQLGCPPGPRL